MRFLFIVQGEGRGHMTQAISLAEMLRAAGHEVCNVLVGKSVRREIPQFFFEKIKAPVSSFESPNFVVDAKNKKINIGKTIWTNTLMLGTFIKSMKGIHQKVKESQPDVIINFYDLLAGLYSMVYRPKAKYICIGHQYLLNHPDFVFPKGYIVDKMLITINTFFTSIGAHRHLALSFKPMPDLPAKKINVVPPLLRPEVMSIQPKNENYILGYMLNSGYADDIEKWHRAHPEYDLHFFWDKKDAPEVLEITHKLHFHKINDVKFLEMMGRCSAFTSTAGFESVCEAMYLGKPIMMVPTYGHFEQLTNAIDAQLAGAGVKSDTFDLSVLIEYMPRHKDITMQFRTWADSSRERFLKLLTE